MFELHSAAPGGRPRLSVERIVQGAIALADFGRQRILDGIARLVERRSSDPPSPEAGA